MTTDFYFTNVKLKPWILPIPPEKKDTPVKSGAAATADDFTPIIEADPRQPGEIHMHSWMLYTPQAPVLRSLLYKSHISTGFTSSIS